MILEGALFEGRVGNKESARKAFRHLIQNCQSYGPIYLEYSKYEEREGELGKAIQICEEGIQFSQKYGPLWFQLLKLYEKNGQQGLSLFRSLEELTQSMLQNLSRELIFKAFLEIGQLAERSNKEEEAKAYLVQSLNNIPDSIKWKLWLIISRLELKKENFDSSRVLIERSLLEVQTK